MMGYLPYQLVQDCFHQQYYRENTICGGVPEILPFVFQKWCSIFFPPKKSWSHISKCDLHTARPEVLGIPSNFFCGLFTTSSCSEPIISARFWGYLYSPNDQTILEGQPLAKTRPKFKKQNKGQRVIWGGPHLSSRYMQKESMPGRLRKTVI